MSSQGGESPRPFDAADSQADMNWLDHQLSRAQTPVDDRANVSGIPHHDLGRANNPRDRAQTPINVESNGSISLSNGLDQRTPIEIDVFRPDSGVPMLNLTSSDQSLASEHSTTHSGASHHEHSPCIKVEEPSKANLHIIVDIASIDLTLDDGIVIKEEQPTETTHWKETVPGEIEILDSEDERDDKAVKQEYHTQTTQWKETVPGHIEISDSEDELDPIIPDRNSENMANSSEVQAGERTYTGENPHLQQSSQAISMPDINTVQMNGFNGGVVEHDQAVSDSQNAVLTTAPNINLGTCVLRTPNSKVKRSAADIAQLKELQAKFRAKALSRDQAAGAGIGAPSANEERLSAKPLSFNPGVNPCTETAFSEDVNDMNRIINDDDGDEGGTNADRRSNDESRADTLFVPQGNNLPTLKRPLAATVETDKEDSDQDVQEIDGSAVPDTRGKPKRKRRPKPQPTSQQDPQQLWDDEWQASLTTQLQQYSVNATKSKPAKHRDLGISQRGHSDNKKGMRSGATTDKTSKGKAKRLNKSQEKSKARADALIADLQPHDVLAEANANLERAALPSVNIRDKQQYLKTLLSTVPKDDRHLPGVRGEKARLLRAATNFGHGAVTAADGGWRFKGMKSILLHHQLLGASFIRNQELGSEQPYGGLLADEMGFGKTVMMIVTMVTNPPPSSDRVKATLIVCSPALILQWKRELGVHATEGVFKRVLIHHASSRLEGEGAEHILEETDVVLTTYGQVVKSFPLEDPPEYLETAEERRNWLEKHWGDKRGLLHRAHFHRVILDEAQAIKNHKAHTSLACQALMARYRWAISGTPIMNRVEELYPYFKFLRVQYTGSFEDFRKNFCGKGDPLYTERLHACLQKFMLRRTHKDLIFGKPIIKLPECHPKTIPLRPTKVEVSIYRAVEMRYVQAVNAIAKRATEEQLKRVTMAMITRLRQMTAHLFLVQHIMQDMFEMEDIKQLWNMVKDEAASRETVIAITGLIDNKEDDEVEPDNGPSSSSNNDNTDEYIQPSEALLKRFQKHLRSLITDADTAEFSKRSTCPRCGNPPEDPYVTSCMHVYCHECLLIMAHQAAEKDEGGLRCLECTTAYTSSMPCVGVKELSYDMGTGFDPENKTPRKRHKPPNDLLKWIRRDGGILPSTKSAAVVEQIDQWLTEEPDKKIIVFSQWHMM
ncbi:MAG: hypothetical protein Q9225_002288 [Loekoesia sp. 1 TL-2023]